MYKVVEGVLINKTRKIAAEKPLYESLVVIRYLLLCVE
jgi:hypothetical protein